MRAVFLLWYYTSRFWGWGFILMGILIFVYLVYSTEPSSLSTLPGDTLEQMFEAERKRNERTQQPIYLALVCVLFGNFQLWLVTPGKHAPWSEKIEFWRNTWRDAGTYADERMAQRAVKPQAAEENTASTQSADGVISDETDDRSKTESVDMQEPQDTTPRDGGGKQWTSLGETFASRRYFAKFEKITGHLEQVSAVMQADGQLTEREIDVLTGYVRGLAYTFRALSMKYLLVGRDTGHFFGSLAMDVTESGFPVSNELMVMANDAQQASRHLQNMPSAEQMKAQMVEHIISERTIPTRLQFSLSQRLYYEELMRGYLFWARNDPQVVWLAGVQPRITYLVHWAVYDSQLNLPTVYLMELEDSNGGKGLPLDGRRWPEVQAHLMGQALGGLKLLTIAKGFDEAFDDLHPKRLRRLHLGPMYSHAFTRQSGPIRDVLAEAKAPAGQDWALAWTDEILESERVEQEKSGWFGSVDREVFALDPFSGRGAETGVTRMVRSLILPERPYQVLAEKAPAGFASVDKYVVGQSGRVLRY